MNIKTHILSTALLVSSTISSQSNNEINSRPNIIFFMVDDMGWQDTSVPFWTEKTHLNEIYHTPHMERLASQGMIFSQAYACSVSSPSRASLFTGMNAARHRVTNWTLQKNTSTDSKSDVLSFPQWNTNGLCQVDGIDNAYNITSLSQLLKDSGYHTIHCGKAHWGAIDTPGENPHHFGFEVNIAGHAAGGLASYLGEDNFGNKVDGSELSLFAIPGLDKYWGEDIFATEALTIEALSALDKAKRLDQPFFLHMSHYAIHIPIDKDMRFYDKYISNGLSAKESAYASLIEGMDKSLGDIMDWLDENKLSDNTIVIFMSDNGGFATSTAWRDEPLYIQNAPLNSGKGSAYEGGIRVPLIVKWKDLVEENARCEDYLIIEDLFPTILEMAQIEDRSTKQVVDGISILPMLKGEKTDFESRALVWHYPNLWGNTGPGIGTTSTIRKGDWKLIYYYDTGKKELFNITEDIGETNNLTLKYPDIVSSLSTELGDYLRSVDAQRPSIKESGEMCRWVDDIF